MKKLYKNSIYNVVYRITNLIFSLVTASYVARILLPSGVGYFSFVSTNVSYFVAFASLGLPVYGVREIAKVKHNKDELNRTYTELFLISVLFTVLACIIYLIFIWKVVKREDLLLYGICGIQILLNVINIDWLYQGCEEYSHITKRNVFIKLLNFFLIIFFVKEKSDLFIYAAISSIITFVQFFYSFVCSGKIALLKNDKISIKKHIKPVIVLGLTVALATIYHKIDITMLGLLSNDVEVGLYTNAHKGIDVIITLCASITGAYLPTLSETYINNSKEFNKILKKGFDIICFISIPATCGIYIVAPEIMGIVFGSEFISGYTAVRFFAPLIVIRSLGDLFCYQTLIAIGEDNKRAIANVVATAINIAINLALIPVMGKNGAAIASVLSELLVNIYLYLYIKKKLGLIISYKSAIISVISSAIMSIICITMIGLNIISPIINFVLCMFVCILVYSLFYLVLTKSFNKIRI